MTDVSISASLSGVDQIVQGIEKITSSLQTTAAKISSTISGGVDDSQRRVQQWQETQARSQEQWLTQNTTGLTKNFTSVESKLKVLEQQFKAIDEAARKGFLDNVPVTTLDRTYQKLQEGIKKAKGEIEETTKKGEAFGKVGNLLKETSIPAVSSLASEIGTVGTVLTRVGGIFGLVFAAAAAVVYKAVAPLIEAAEATNILSQRTGIATEKLAGYELMAKATGQSTESLVHGIDFLSRRMREANDSTSEAARIFGVMGISLTDATGKAKTSEQILLEVADAFKEMPNGASKAQLAMELFGLAGTRLIPTLNKGREELEYWNQIAQQTGRTIDQETARAASELKDILVSLQAGIGSLLREAFKPMIIDLGEVAAQMKLAQKEGDGFWGTMLAGARAWLSLKFGNTRSELADINKQIKETELALRTAEEAVERGAYGAAQSVEGQLGKLARLYTEKFRLQELLPFETPGGLGAGEEKPDPKVAERLRAMQEIGKAQTAQVDRLREELKLLDTGKQFLREKRDLAIEQGRSTAEYDQQLANAGRREFEVNKQIFEIQRSMGAESRQMAQARIESASAIEGIEHTIAMEQLKALKDVGVISEQQFIRDKTALALQRNEEEQLVVEKKRNLGSLNASEKLNLDLTIERLRKQREEITVRGEIEEALHQYQERQRDLAKDLLVEKQIQEDITDWVRVRTELEALSVKETDKEITEAKALSRTYEELAQRLDVIKQKRLTEVQGGGEASYAGVRRVQTAEVEIKVRKDLAVLDQQWFVSNDQQKAAITALGEKYKQLAEDGKITGDDLATAMKQVEGAQERVRTSAEEFGARLRAIFGNLSFDWINVFEGMNRTFQSFFADILRGTRSFGDSFKNLWKGIVDSVISELSRILANQALGVVLRALGFSGVGGLFGGMGGGVGGAGLTLSSLFGLGGGGGGYVVPGAVGGSGNGGGTSVVGGGGGVSILPVSSGGLSVPVGGGGMFGGSIADAFTSAGVAMGSQSVADIGNFLRNIGVVEEGGSLLAGGAGGVAGGAGNALGSILPYAGAFLQLLSGNVRGAAFSAAGTALGSFFGPIGGVVGGIAGSALGSLFGGGRTPSVGTGYSWSGAYSLGQGLSLSLQGLTTTGPHYMPEGAHIRQLTEVLQELLVPMTSIAAARGFDLGTVRDFSVPFQLQTPNTQRGQDEAYAQIVSAIVQAFSQKLNVAAPNLTGLLDRIIAAPYAVGGEFIATSPRLIMVGERGPERAQVTPLAGGSGVVGGSGIVNNFNGPFISDNYSMRLFMRNQERALRSANMRYS